MRLISELAHTDAPSVETDIIESGLLDSLLFVELIAGLEERFGVHITLDDIELDNFRSVRKIAEFVNRRSAPQTMAVSGHAG
jgi:acyl carrier protein